MKKQPVQHSREEIVYGIQPVLEAFASGRTIDKIMIQKGSENPLLKEIQAKAYQYHVPTLQVPIEKLSKITRKNHQGVIALMAAVDFTPLHQLLPTVFEKGEIPLVLLLDRITDVRNLGAIARSAECAGVHGIIVPFKETAQLGSDAMRTSAGALHHVPVCREKSLKQTVKFLQESGLQVVACTEKAEKNLYQMDFTLPTAIVVGSEEDGISPEILQSVDELVRIPMCGKVSSLNVSVATGVMLFEVRRQRLQTKF
ncbi:MAG: 23S rRNA (guanosine(2251)-2'-O)-methyltransferase RlmB [Flammeovirgaceae bacterium]|nr:23S rRNA (guanosine(2251)-2'-O)-methyltransferase RlmB [Flammeovirgaceae bacterium]MDW8288676.1 23S rRNA (guanosine(2251)-2'-O)-methyltransferase RlmB [Flammeovirgaceae bacterium]